jgi:hypothetical protein
LPSSQLARLISIALKIFRVSLIVFIFLASYSLSGRNAKKIINKSDKLDNIL